jgi:hypothetical protein
MFNVHIGNLDDLTDAEHCYTRHDINAWTFLGREAASLFLLIRVYNASSSLPQLHINNIEGLKTRLMLAQDSLQ